MLRKPELSNVTYEPVGLNTLYFFLDQEEENAEPTRIDVVRKLVKEATGRDEVDSLYNYGCWCGKRGHGKYVDNFDL